MTIREPALETWSSAIDEFPVCGTPREKLEALVSFAIRAPSSHNSQPWRFTGFSDHLELKADLTRRLPVVDPVDRELTISCGAALGCLEIALHHFGYEGSIELVPRTGDSELLARVQLGEAREPTLMDHALFTAIQRRRTHRRPFLPRTPDAELMAALEAYGDQHTAWFRILQTQSRRNALIGLVSEGDRVQMADPAFRRELADWLHPNHSKSRDGMPGWTFGLNTVESVAIPLVVRTFDTGMGRAAIDRDLAEGSPLLAVLGTPSDTRHDWMQAGRVLMQLLLRATVDGVAASFLNQPVEIPELRRRVGALLGFSEYPQLILRMGYPQGEDRLAPRRDPADVIERVP
jgi:nitroreductase